jgi:hypothetical protein
MTIDSLAPVSLSGLIGPPGPVGNLDEDQALAVAFSQVFADLFARSFESLQSGDDPARLGAGMFSEFVGYAMYQVMLSEAGKGGGQQLLGAMNYTMGAEQ